LPARTTSTLADGLAQRKVTPVCRSGSAGTERKGTTVKDAFPREIHHPALRKNV